MSTIVCVKVACIRPLGYDNLKAWCEDSNNVYIGRAGPVFVEGQRYPKSGSKWANVFKVGRDGTLEEVIQKYENYVRGSPVLMSKLHELRGKNLGCWCKPKPCHGDALIKLLRETQ